MGNGALFVVWGLLSVVCRSLNGELGEGVAELAGVGVEAGEDARAPGRRVAGEKGPGLAGVRGAAGEDARAPGGGGVAGGKEAEVVRSSVATVPEGS